MTAPEPTIADILARYRPGRESLIPVLQDLQHRDGYLAPDVVRELAKTTGISRNEIYGVATFYTQFRFVPPAAHTISVCQGTACHVRGSHQLLADLQDRLQIHPGETTEDGKFGIERVACVGCCALAPVLVVDGEVRAKVQQKKIKRLIKQLDK
jgi:NADH-quinone oxidoreductase subunit E